VKTKVWKGVRDHDVGGQIDGASKFLDDSTALEAC